LERYADRVLEMREGELVTDRRSNEPPNAAVGCT